MDSEKRDVEKRLNFFLCEKTNITPSLASKWRWRILNEYPEDLKLLIFEWVKGHEIPDIEYNGVSLQTILDNTYFEFLDAVDLLYIMHKDPASGYDIFVESMHFDILED